jgi:hypothetical protein
MEQTKTSIEWCKTFRISGLQQIDEEPDELDEKCRIFIIDPDGWDRQNYDESILEEITASEFNERLGGSTCRFIRGMWKIIDTDMS